MNNDSCTFFCTWPLKHDLIVDRNINELILFVLNNTEFDKTRVHLGGRAL